MDKNKFNFEKIVNHLIVNGYMFPGSQIYGGLANTWDYGPLGVELKNNIKQYWWNFFVQKFQYNVGIDSSILMNPKVWEATKHLSTFNDPLIDCKKCKSRFRADELVKEQIGNNLNFNVNDIDKLVSENQIICPICKQNTFTKVRQFNMMFKTNLGVVSDTKSEVFLRPETAQGVFVNFKNVQRSCRKQIPFGICNVGKSFRNEITPGNFTFRMREFEQLEMEFFCKPGTDSQWFKFWKEKCWLFIKTLGINEKKLRFREHTKNELAFYSKSTTDLEYYFPTLEWGEILGIANRTDYDLKCHMNLSKESLEYLDPKTNEKYIPYCIEPSMGLDRLVLMILTDSYDEELISDTGENRVIMHIKPFLAPYKVIILPLSKQLNNQAQKIFEQLSQKMTCIYDEKGSIGKRYRRADSIGVPFAVTIDFDTDKDGCVTIRERDTMKQIRKKISDVSSYILEKIEFDKI